MMNAEKYDRTGIWIRNITCTSGVEERIYTRGKYLARIYILWKIREIYNKRFVLISERALFTFSHDAHSPMAHTQKFLLKILSKNSNFDTNKTFLKRIKEMQDIKT